MKKSQVSINVFFMILMAIFFIAIIVFGINQLYNVESHISKQEKLELKKDFQEVFSYCEDPLKDGDFKVLKIKAKEFNGIYLVGNDVNNNNYGVIDKELKTVYNSSENVILFKADYSKDTDGNYSFTNFNIVDTFKIDVNFDFVGFYIDGDMSRNDTQDGIIEVKVFCED